VSHIKRSRACLATLCLATFVPCHLATLPPCA
jgi:hypothetical protein